MEYRIFYTETNLMDFKKSFDTEREAKQHAWDDLPASMKPDNIDVHTVHTSDPVSETAIVISPTEDWINTPNSGVLYIIEHTVSTCSIEVESNTTTDKWTTEILLNPVAYGYDEAIECLLNAGWSRQDIQFHERPLTDTDIENAVLYKVYIFEKYGERLLTKDIRDALYILLSTVEYERSHDLIVREILKKLHKKGLVAPLGDNGWQTTDKGKARMNV